MTANKLIVAGAAAAVVLAGAVMFTLHRQDGSQSAPAGAAVQSSADGAGGANAGAARKGDKGGDKPLWRSLTPAQQTALQPLAAEWDQMDGVRKQKWLQLANRFATLGPEQQQRVHERMREWARLTPEQRELARETFTRTRKIAPEQKNATWESYLQLPEEQKKKLADSATGRKAPRVVPSQAGSKSAAPLGQGATSCPAGTVRNTMSAVPPCITPPQPAPQPPLPVQPPANAQPSRPSAPEPEKQVPANWGITPNNA